MAQAVITNPEHAARYALAGKAYVTLVSEKSGKRFTYRIRASKDKKVRFVGVLTGPDNTRSYAYLGWIDGRDEYHPGKPGKRKIDLRAPSSLAYEWFHQFVIRDRTMPASLKVYHSGKCGCCGRPLTVPKSIERGLGPECWSRTGGTK